MQSKSKQVFIHPHEVQVAPNGEVLHDGPLAVKQDWDKYTPADHEMWTFLYKNQLENLKDIAYSPWLAALDKIGLEPNKIPKLSDLAYRIDEMTGWIPVPIAGFLTPHDYFAYLARREFPTVVRIRTMDVWDFQVEPDLFHDAFGHLPMHSLPVLADFMQLFGKVAIHAKTEQQLVELTRLYWFTVEYGLIREHGKVKVCGSGHMSGFKEARYSLSDEVEKRPFKLEDVVKQEYNPHALQPVLFVMESYEQLYESMAKKAKEFHIE